MDNPSSVEAQTPRDYLGAADQYMQRFNLVSEDFPFYDRPGDIYVPKNISVFVIENGMKGLQNHIAQRLEQVGKETKERIADLAISHPHHTPAPELARLSFINGLFKQELIRQE